MSVIGTRILNEQGGYHATCEITHHNPYLEWAGKINYQRAYTLTGKQFASLIFLPVEQISRKQAAQMIEQFNREFPQVKLWQKLQQQPHCD